MCADGVDQYGPRVVATTPGTVTLRFTQPPEAVSVETESEADAGASPVDPTHWNAIISAPALANGTRVHVSARGPGWSAVWVARLDQVAEPDPLRATVSSVRYFRRPRHRRPGRRRRPVRRGVLRVRDAPRAPCLVDCAGAADDLRAHQVTLHRGQAHKVRHGGQLVLAIVAGGQHKTVRVTLK